MADATIEILISRSRALGLLAASPVLVPAAAGAQPAPVRIASVAADSYAEPFFAADGGFFARAGIDAQITRFASSGAAAAACAGGAVDVALTDISVIANAVDRGLPFTAIAGSGLYAPNSSTTALVALADSPFKTAKDLEGQAIAVVTLVSVSSVAVKAWLTKNGADIAKVKIVEIPFPEMGAALQRGTVAAAFDAEPSLSQLPPEIHTIGDPYGAIARSFLISVWFTTHDWLAKNADVAKRLVPAVYDAARWSNGHHDQTAAILAKYSKLPVDRVQHMRRAEFATALKPEMLQPVLDAGFTYKAIPRHFDAAALMTEV